MRANIYRFGDDNPSLVNSPRKTYFIIAESLEYFNAHKGDIAEQFPAIYTCKCGEEYLWNSLSEVSPVNMPCRKCDQYIVYYIS